MLLKSELLAKWAVDIHMTAGPVARWEHLIYQLGSHQHLISHVIKAGKIVYQKPANL